MTGRTKPNIKNRYIKYLGINLGLFACYAGELSIVLWLASAVILGLLVRRLPNWLLAYTSLLILFFAARILLESSPPEEILRDVRFFWGFLIFLSFFISEQRQLGSHFTEYESLFRFLINAFLILLLIEFLTANLLFMEWPNRSHEFGREIGSGSFARAYGFGGNATVTSTLLMALGAILYAGKYIRDIATLGLATSGTGFLALLMKLGLMLKTRQLLMFGGIFVVFFTMLWVDVLESGLRDTYRALGKFSLEYFLHLIDFKYEQYQYVMAGTSDYQLAFGQAIINSPLRTGDFQALDFLTFNGLFGLGMLVLVVGKCMNKTNRVPLILVLTATIHYHVIFSLPGQILFAWLLTVGMRSSQRRYKSPHSVSVNSAVEPHAVRG